MKDQSHKEEMSAAIRRDFERLRERGVSAGLSPREQSAPAPEPSERPPSLDLPPSVRVSPEPESAPAHREGWLGRLLGRS